MRIRMLKTTPGSVDGIKISTYEAEQEYDLTATHGERQLAAAFVGAGLAVDLSAKASAPSAQEQAPADQKPVEQPPRRGRK